MRPCTAGWTPIRPAGSAPDFAEQVFVRYMRAFGPASVRDVQAWSGLTRLGEIADRLGDGLRRYRDEDGVELLDTPDGRLVDADSPIGPIFVAPYDNVILSHADRRRVISDADRVAIQTKSGIVPGTVLIDGLVAGTWRVDTVKKAATLVVTPFRTLTRTMADALEAPARALATFVADTADSHTVHIGRPD